MTDCPKHYWCLPERCPYCPDKCDQACQCHGQFTAPNKCQCCTPRSVTRRRAIQSDAIQHTTPNAVQESIDSVDPITATSHAAGPDEHAIQEGDDA